MVEYLSTVQIYVNRENAKRINADDSNGNNLSHENELLKNLAGLRGITASDVMVPRIDIVSVAMSDDFNEIVKQLIVIWILNLTYQN